MRGCEEGGGSKGRVEGGVGVVGGRVGGKGEKGDGLDCGWVWVGGEGREVWGFEVGGVD